MHISEGILSAPVLASGAAITVAGTTVGLRKLDWEQLPKVALLAAVFFVASLIHLPLGPSSLHLLLGGLVGILLGWAAFPAMLVSLALQAILFQFGGLVVLGANTAIMALPAVACHYGLAGLIRSQQRSRVLVAGFLAGFLSVLGSALLAGLALYLSGEAMLGAAQALVVAHLPLMGVEGVFTAVALGFLQQVRPAMLYGEAV